MKISRRSFFSRLAFYGTPVTAFGYGSLIEKRWVDVTHTDIPLSEDHSHLDGLKIGVMADFHHDDFGDNQLIRRAVQHLNEEQVDIVMLPGDFISNDPAALEPLCHELKDLRPRLRSFAVPGNHDRWHGDFTMPRLLADAGVTLLINEVAEFSDFSVVGLDSMWGGAPDLPRTFTKAAPDKPILLGWHEPDTFNLYKDPRVVVQMSGHTHGGQVCAPAYGPILLPRYGKIYPYGHYRKEQSSLFVTRGIGTLTIPTRFLCAPEAAILTLRATPPAAPWHAPA